MRMFQRRHGRRSRALRATLNVLALVIGFSVFISALLFAVDMASPPPPEPARTAPPAAGSSFENSAATARAPDHESVTPAGPVAPIATPVDEGTSGVRSEGAPQARDVAPVAKARADTTREESAKVVRRQQPPRAKAAASREDSAEVVRRQQPQRRETTTRPAKQVPREPPRREPAEETSQGDDAADDFSVRWHRAGG